VTGLEPPIDRALESLTAALVQLTGEARMREQVRLVAAPGWRLLFWLDLDTFGVDLCAEAQASIDELDDYQLAVVYGLGFTDEDVEGEVRFRQEFEYDPADEWEEQAIRELALLVLGLLRDVIDCDPATFDVSIRSAGSA
jgi:hypothetical protein